MKPIYVLGVIVVGLFISECGCPQDVDSQHYWVICTMGVPELTNGDDIVAEGKDFNPAQWSCPDTSGSPIWQGSARPVYSNVPLHSQARQAGKAVGSPGSAAYLPPRLLDLPFIAQPSAADGSPTPCDATFPDVIQVNHDYAVVNRISSCGLQLKATIPVVTRPLQIAITPDGSTALVTSFDNAVNFIDLTSNQVTYTLNTAFNINPHGVAITPDGAHAYITSFNNINSVVQEIDLTTHAVVGSIQVTSYPQSAFMTPDGSQVYITFPFASAVYVIDTLTNTVANTIAIPNPRGLAFNSQGTKAYISSASGSPGTIQELNTTTFHVDTVYQVGTGPSDVSMLYGDRYVIVNNYEGQSISTIDTTTGMVKTTAVQGSPSGISIVR